MSSASFVRCCLLTTVSFLLLTSLQAQDNGNETQELVFPTVVSTDYREAVFLNTTLIFMNLSNTTAQLELTAFADREPVPVFGSPTSSNPQKSTRILEMAPNSAEQITLSQEEGENGESAFFDGWVLLQTDKDLKVQGSSEVRRIEEVGVVSDTQLPAMKPAHQFQVFTTFDWICKSGAESMSAFSFVNPSEEEVAQVHVTVDADFERTLELPPRSRLSLFLSELFPGFVPERGEVCLAVSFVHQVDLVMDVSSDLPIAVSALDFDLSTGQFVALPVSVETE